MAAVEIDDSIPGKLAKPRVKRQRSASQVISQLVGRNGEGILDHIGWIDACLQAAVEVDRNHFPEARPMPSKELLTSRQVTVCRPIEQLIGARISRGHRFLPLLLTPQKKGKGLSQFFGFSGKGHKR
jgi:hypothetical protein